MISFFAQFAHPKGFWGSLVGYLMAQKNRERNQWTIALLGLGPADHVLEIGFGPGWAVQQVAGLVPRGRVAGVDISETMLRQASRRNAAAIRAGQVSLRLGGEAPLPFEAGTFDKAFAVNSIQFWAKPLAGLKELKRVAKPGGRVAITIQPMGAQTDAEALKVGDRLIAQLSEAGFGQVRLEIKLLSPLCVCGIGNA